ncbi:hypothetical protein CONLIGDRAFT_718833 [Coniochaeta ligniaria NRRL 30616]|uniref:Class I glutamine amidotransferase-like protein n=1 Tax=Coniochaeta ligniaria NRRL 30616 TaxID=1408157 RepID=A0A1J7I8A8_9PEZI|nr:hypothetical protein CONLIGDRAFT_718833 [Coniochaeta ligniaria NRRL 30616]
MSAPTNPPTIRVGVMMENVQLADIVGIDILGNLTPSFMSKVLATSPAHAALATLAVPFEFFYLATTLDPAPATPSLRFVPNVTYDSCPRDLDIVIVGGPFLDHRPPAAERFMKEAWGRTRVWIATCTGGLWLASSGVLGGKELRATTNRGLLRVARELYPGVEWVERRWVCHEKEYEGEGTGELWTAGGAGCGIDMIATYALQNYDERLVRALALDSLEFNPEQSNTQFYKT